MGTAYFAMGKRLCRVTALCVHGIKLSVDLAHEHFEPLHPHARGFPLAKICH